MYQQVEITLSFYVLKNKFYIQNGNIMDSLYFLRLLQVLSYLKWQQSYLQITPKGFYELWNRLVFREVEGWQLWKSETFSWNSSPSSLLTLPSSFIWVEEARKEGEGDRHVTSPVSPCMCGVITNQKGESMRSGVCSTVLLPLRQLQIPKTAASLNQQIHLYTTTQTKEASICIHLIFYLSNFQRQVSVAKSYFSLPKLAFPPGSRVAEY